MAKQFATLDDALSLGTTFEVFRVSTRKGGDWETIYNKDGGFLQKDSRVTVHTIRVDAYCDSGATIPERGATLGNAFIVDEVEDSGENRRHRTIAVTATAQQNVTLTSVLTRA